MSSTGTGASQINVPVSSQISLDSRNRNNNVDPNSAGNGKYFTIFILNKSVYVSRNLQIDYFNNIHIGFYSSEQHHFPSNSSATLGTGSKDHAPTTSRRGMIGGSIKSLPSQDSIGTSSSICGDNVSITSSTRRTSGSFNSASRQRYNQHLGARHATKSSNNTLTSKTGGASETKRSSISSAQSQG